MKSKILMTVISIIVVTVLLSGACSAGFIAGRVFNPPQQVLTLLPGLAGTPAPDSQADTPADLTELFVPFWQTWALVHDQYVDQPVDNELLMRGAIKGMLEALGDPHTSYLNPDENKQLTAALQGNGSYEGIGAWVDTTADYLTVISPIPGAPAEKADLRTGDKIIAVDGIDMTGVAGELVRQKVIGPAGSQVILTILRSGQEPFDVSITRASITIPSVDHRMLDNNIGYVRILIFADNTKEQLRAALEDLIANKPTGLILDLRNNGGGYLESAVDVASEFIDSGIIVYEEYGDGHRNTFQARRGGLATDIPMVVLINKGTASASEIVAGAIQDTGRGKLVGVTSYGKGSVQLPTILKNQEGAVHITVARWLTPNERTIQGIGLTPDEEVPITDQDLSEKRDPQLEKAVDSIQAISK
jgi:carboxyl-terminal processing protease